MRITNIAVIGVGGVGGYFGGKLCSAKPTSTPPARHVSFVARGEHLRAIREHGLIVQSQEDGERVHRPDLATDDFHALPPPDLCLLCVKEFDLGAALDTLKEHISRETIILPLLNGMDVPNRIRRVLSDGVVLPACVYVGTHIERPGRIVQDGGACQILFGPDPQHPDFQPDELLALFAESRIKAEYTTRIASEIWQKFIFISAFGLVSAAYHRTVGEILDDHGLRIAVELIMREAAMLADLDGVPLPADIIAQSFAKARTFPRDARTSFQRDFARSTRPDERALFGGALLELATRLGRAIPGTRDLYALLEREKPTPDVSPNRYIPPLSAASSNHAMRLSER